MAAPEARLTAHQRAVRDVRRAALARAVLAARTSAGLTQTRLAERAGLSRSAIARLESGEAPIASDRLWDIAVALDIRPSDLLLAPEADDAAAKTLDQ